VHLSIGVESAVDFSSAISELIIVSKGSSLCHVIVEANSICPDQQHLIVGSGTTYVSQSGKLIN